MTEKIICIKNKIREAHPLVHCITNPISINQCANAVLAAGARPIMAEHPREVEEITAQASSVVLNLGNITDVRMESMAVSTRTAKENSIPVVLDLVGIACSSLRRDFSKELISVNTPAMIKGNYSEIYALYSEQYSCPGVDADATLDMAKIAVAAKRLAEEYSTIVLASGSTDIVTNGKKTLCIHNGTPELAQVTGTGCMLGALCGCYFAVKSDLTAAAAACVHMAVSGELAVTDKGNGSFAVNLMDRLSSLSDTDICKYIRLEEYNNETI
ncbi:MAG: hydroxyethylthiazole kinase [Clostridia bacterium]|nr:hydroxyethylthiazole kinase [Clostridia bacterium]